jgi:hypothetical protein
MAYDEPRLNEAPPSANQQMVSAPRVSPLDLDRGSKHAFVWISFWRFLFVCSTIMVGLITLQLIWVMSFEGISGVRRWAMRISDATPERAWVGWIEVSVLSVLPLALLFWSWHKQHERSREHLFNRHARRA